jgi:hypothetical protein
MVRKGPRSHLHLSLAIGVDAAPVLGRRPTIPPKMGDGLLAPSDSSFRARLDVGAMIHS